MNIDGWKYYNHAAIPTTPPYEDANTAPILNGKIWKSEGRATPLLARWTTDFDCDYETNWWYLIKDASLDVTLLKAKRRYEINKGTKNFDIKIINPCKYKSELFDVQIAAFSAYPKKYRPTVEKQSFFEAIEKWDKYLVYGAFHKETQKLSGYSLLDKKSEIFIDFCVQKADPAFESLGVNAALVYGVLESHEKFLSQGGIICDGARSINHETKFQDYLEKYFCFRKAYCHLHIVYNPKVKWIIKSLYPLRKIFFKLDGIALVHQLNSVFRMEEIWRKTKIKF